MTISSVGAIALAVLPCLASCRKHESRTKPAAAAASVPALSEDDVLVSYPGGQVTRADLRRVAKWLPEQLSLQRAGQKALAKAMVRVELLSRLAKEEALDHDPHLSGFLGVHEDGPLAQGIRKYWHDQANRQPLYVTEHIVIKLKPSEDLID